MATKIYNWKDLSLYPTDGLVTGVNAVSQAIFNVLNITPSELYFNPEFGCDLEALLFEPMDEFTEMLIFEEIIKCVTKWEPRITVARSESSIIGSPDNNSYDVILVIKIVGSEEQFNYSFALFRTSGEN